MNAITSAGQPYTQIKVTNGRWEGHPSGIFTFGCDCVENIPRGDSTWWTTLAVGERYYFNSKSKKVLGITAFPSNATNYNFRAVSYCLVKPGEFDFTVSNAFCYEGAYMNPPYYKSFDVEINNPLLCNDLSNLYLYELKKLNFGKGWLRVCHLGTYGSALETFNNLNLFKVGGNARAARIVIKYFWLKVNNSEGYGYISVDSYQAASLVRFTAARFAKDSDGDLFLEVYNNVSNSTNDNVYATTVDCTYGYDSTGAFARGAGRISMYKVNESSGDNDTLVGTQVSIGANTNLFSII